MSGYVLLYRQLLDNPVFNSDAEAMAFAWMVLKASWKPVSVRYKGRPVDLERGQLCMSVRDMAERLERSKDWVSRFLTRLENAKMIVKNRDRGCDATATQAATASATASNVISICNYDKYQANIDTGATAPRQSTRQHRDSTATQNKEGNKGIRDTNVSQDGSTLPAKPKAKSPKFEPERFVTPPAIPRNDWDRFIEMRRAIGKPVKTESGAQGLVDKLRELAEDGHPPGEVLRQSIAFEWQGLFHLRDRGNRHGNGSSATRTEKPGTTGPAAARLRERLAAQAVGQDELFGVAGDGGQRLVLPAK